MIYYEEDTKNIPATARVFGFLPDINNVAAQIYFVLQIYSSAYNKKCLYLDLRLDLLEQIAVRG